jgi:Neuraminidase (sialidase)
MHTDDAGQTWSSPLTIYTHEQDGEVPKVVANKPAIDSDGIFYLPFHTEPLKSYEVFNSKTWHPLKEASENGNIPSIQCPSTAKDQGMVTFAGCLVSIDGGAQWTVAGHIEDAKTWLVQPAIEKITDDDLLMLFRTTGKLYSSRSADKGSTWSKPVATSIINPNAKFSTVTIGTLFRVVLT